MTTTPQNAPHCNPTDFGGLIESLAVDAILVVISNWMGHRLRSFVSPEDVWQETLHMVWRDRQDHEWRDRQSYRNWILTIARNRVHDLAAAMSTQKRGGDRQFQSLSALTDRHTSCDGSLTHLLPAHSNTPARQANWRERAETMRTALESLPEHYGDAVRLRIFEQLPMAEVAEQLGIALSTAKKRVYLGAELYRDRLREVLTRIPTTKP